MFELLAGTWSAHHHICLSKAFRSDLQWWATYTGTCLQLQWQQAHTKEWEALQEESILLKELLTVVLACSVWA